MEVTVKKLRKPAIVYIFVGMASVGDEKPQISQLSSLAAIQ